MGQQMGWFRASILCALSVAALTVCSGYSPLVASPSSSPGPGDKPAPPALADARRSIVEDLAAPLNVSLKSAHFSIETTFESGGGRAVWTTDGVADLVGDRFGGTISGSATGSQATSIRFLDVGSTQYTTDGPGKSWRAAAFVADQLPLTKPEVYLVGHIQDTGRPSYTDDLELKKHIVDTFITGLTSKGTELLHGSWAFHYDVALDGEHLDGKLPAAVVQERGVRNRVLGGVDDRFGGCRDGAAHHDVANEHHLDRVGLTGRGVGVQQRFGVPATTASRVQDKETWLWLKQFQHLFLQDGAVINKILHRIRGLFASSCIDTD